MREFLEEYGAAVVGIATVILGGFSIIGLLSDFVQFVQQKRRRFQ